MMMNKNNTTRCLMTLLLSMGMGGVVSAQTFSSIGEVKQLTSNANVTINFQPNTVQVAALVDRTRGRVDFGVPFTALVQAEVNLYPAEHCPLCAKGVPMSPPRNS